MLKAYPSVICTSLILADMCRYHAQLSTVASYIDMISVIFIEGKLQKLHAPVSIHATSVSPVSFFLISFLSIDCLFYLYTAQSKYSTKVGSPLPLLSAHISHHHYLATSTQHHQALSALIDAIKKDKESEDGSDEGRKDEETEDEDEEETEVNKDNKDNKDNNKTAPATSTSTSNQHLCHAYHRHHDCQQLQHRHQPHPQHLCCPHPLYKCLWGCTHHQHLWGCTCHQHQHLCCACHHWHQLYHQYWYVSQFL